MEKDKCPKCGSDFVIHNNPDAKYYGIKSCSGRYCSYVMCVCGTRMLPDAKYIPEEGKFRFFRCPHCFKRW